MIPMSHPTFRVFRVANIASLIYGGATARSFVATFFFLSGYSRRWDYDMWKQVSDCCSLARGVDGDVWFGGRLGNRFGERAVAVPVRSSSPAAWVVRVARRRTTQFVREWLPGEH